MPDNDPRVNAPHLAPRLAVPAGAYGPEPGIPERVTALEVEGLLAAGDTGGVRHRIRELEHGLGHCAGTDPWRLLEHLLDLGMIRPREPAASTAVPGTGNMQALDGERPGG